jgi:hypothetical protein
MRSPSTVATRPQAASQMRQKVVVVRGIAVLDDHKMRRGARGAARDKGQEKDVGKGRCWCGTVAAPERGRASVGRLLDMRAEL